MSVEVNASIEIANNFPVFSRFLENIRIIMEMQMIFHSWLLTCTIFKMEWPKSFLGRILRTEISLSGLTD